MTSRLPFDGIRVVEYGQTTMAPYCTRLLADAGADVIKVEPPEGDMARRRGPFPGDVPDPERSGLFLLLNVNKRGACLDIATREGRKELDRLLASARVLVTDLCPREARRLRLEPRRLRRAFPQLLITSITPFGETGPYRDFRANDHVVYNMGGLAYATPGMPDHVDDPRKEPPLRPATPIAEFIAGATGATATAMGLLRQARDGCGHHVEVSAQEAVAFMLYQNVVAYSYGRLITGRLPIQMARMPNAVMPCQDGYVILAVPYDHMWKPFVALMGNPDWAHWECFRTSLLRAAHWDALYPLLLEWTMRFSGEEIMRMTQGIGLACFVAYTIDKVVRSQHEKERGFFWNLEMDRERPALVPGSPFIFSRTPLGLRRPAPKLGEHTEEILHDAAPDARPGS